MTITRSYNYIIAAILIVTYLALPATVLAHADTLDVGLASDAVCYCKTTVPCDDSPCSDGHGSDCCDSEFCLCECHAPLGQGLRLTYAPVIASQSFWETSWSLPQVFRTIFVPPQNLV